MTCLKIRTIHQFRSKMTRRYYLREFPRKQAIIESFAEQTIRL
jgi:hypothetical protein